MGDWLVRNFLQPLFYWLDKIIYGFVQNLYNLFFQISNVSILSDTTVADFAQRIYVIIGVFMLFKVAISLITMLVSPDKIARSGSSLIKKIVVALVLLVITPNIFTLAYRIQSYIIQDNVLGNLILGAASDPEQVKYAYTNGGELIALQVFKGFFHPKVTADNSVEIKTAAECGEGDDDEACIYAQADSVDDLGELISSENYSYSFLISTIAGGFVAWMLLMFCFDLAVRSVKLSFLQLIAPVPILASINDSDSIFKNWLKETTSCFLNLFIRLITIYFIIFIIAELVRENGFGYYVFDATLGDPVYQSGASNWLLSAFVIIGLLLFAKQVPQLISKIFGIEEQKAFSGNGAFFGAALGGAIGSGLANLGAHYIGRHQFKKDHEGNWDTETQAEYDRLYGGPLRGLRTTVGGASSGFFRAGASGLKGKGMRESMTAARMDSIHARQNREMGYGFSARAWDKFTDFTGSAQKSGAQSERAGRIKELLRQQDYAKVAMGSSSDAYNRQLSSVDGRYQSDLVNIFNGFGGRTDVDYQDYLFEVARRNGVLDKSDEEIQSMTESARADLERQIRENANMLDKYIDQDTFAGMAAQFNERNRQAQIIEKLDKEITKMEEANNIGKKKS